MSAVHHTTSQEPIIHQRYVGNVLHMLMWMTICSLLLQLIRGVTDQNPRYLFSASMTVVCLVGVVVARYLTLRKHFETAITTVAVSFLLAIVGIAVFVPSVEPALLLGVTLVALVMLTTTHGAALRVGLIVCWAVGVLITAISVIQQRVAPGPPYQIDSVGLVLMWLSTTVVLWLSWKFHQRLVATLDDSHATNVALQSTQIALTSQNEWLSIILHSMSDAVIVTDQHGSIQLANRAAEALTSYREGQSKHFADVLQFSRALVPTVIDDPVADVLATQVAQSFSASDGLVLHTPQGKRYYVQASFSPIFTGKRNLTGVVVVINDMSQYRRAQQALSRTEKWFGRVFQSNLCGILISTIVEDNDLRIVTANDQFLSIIECERKHAIGRTLRQLNVGAESTLLHQRIKQLQAGVSLHNVELGYRTANNTIREVLVSADVVQEQGESYVISMVQDITERKRTEQALRESEVFYRLIAEHTQDLIALVDEQQRYIYVSPSHGRVLGYHVAQIIGTDLFDLVHPDDQQSFEHRWRALSLVGEQQVAVRLRQASGDWRWFEVQATAISQQDARAVVVVARDTSQRRELEAQFHQSQKMEGIGRLAGGVAHDFNNLLSVVLGYTELVLGDLTPDTAIYHDLSQVQRAAARGAELSRQLLTFARRQKIEMQTVNVNTLVLELDKMLRRLLGEDIELVTLVAAEACVVRADPGQLEQVLINLAVNARDAMPGGGKLVIGIEQHILDETFVDSYLLSQAGSYVQISVTDTGTGMDAEVQQHVFEPFFTTKSQGKGTGLGLATCYGIVKQHQGSILCHSEVGHGTAFKVYLPSAAPAPRTGEQTHDLPADGGTETILLAEDERSVRDLAARVLRAQGYTVLEAANGDEALRMVAEHGDCAIHLLLSDIVMPHMGGLALSQRLIDLRPGIRVLFMSGYPGNASLDQPDVWAQSAFIQKPFAITALAKKVRELLDG